MNKFDEFQKEFQFILTDLIVNGKSYSFFIKALRRSDTLGNEPEAIHFQNEPCDVRWRSFYYLGHKISGIICDANYGWTCGV